MAEITLLRLPVFCVHCEIARIKPLERFLPSRATLACESQSLSPLERKGQMSMRATRDVPIYAFPWDFIFRDTCWFMHSMSLPFLAYS